MTPAKVIVRFFVLLGLSYTLLMLPWPGLRQTYARFFRAGNQLVLGSFGRDGVVRFVPMKKAGSRHDTRMSFLNRRTGLRVFTTFGSGAMGYAPAAFLTALLISTPLPLRRRAGAFLLGMLLLHAVVGLTFFLHITYVFGTDPHIATFSLSEFSERTLAELIRLVLFAPFFKLVVPTFIWMLVTFRSGDLAMIVRVQRKFRSANNRRQLKERASLLSRRNRAGVADRL